MTNPTPAPVEALKPCPSDKRNHHDCPNMKYVDDTNMSGERYRCAVCGYGYFLDYDDMR